MRSSAGEAPDEFGHVAVIITTLRPEHVAAFEALNREWLVSNELLEPADEPHLTDPEGRIVAAGGQVFVALEDEMVIGTCGVVPTQPDEFEVVKLAVASSARGRGIGRQLVNACLAHARQLGARQVVLLSNSRLVPALRLYEKVGFRYAPLPASNPYATGDVYMVLDLRNTQNAVQTASVV